MSLYQSKAFWVWCNNAVSGIIFTPDRERVFQELFNHMQDHYDILVESGMEPKEAEKQTVSAMGDAREIAPLLAAIHRPFWGRFLRITRLVLLAALVLALSPVGKFIWNMDYEDPMIWDHDIYDASNYGGDTGRTLLMLSEPEISFEDSGYTFTVTDAVLWEQTNEGEESAYLYCRIRQFNPRPWAELPDFLTEVACWFRAEDSLGTYYYSMNTQDYRLEEPCVYVRGSQTSPLTYEYDLWINDIDPSVQWVDIIYDRDGRDHALRIHLTGGVQE